MHKLIFCGDFCLAAGSNGDRIYSSGRNTSPLTYLAEHYGGGAFIAANLEAPITTKDKGRPFKWANLRIDPSRHSLLKGLDLAILGNNHIGDFGDDACFQTVDFLEDLGIACVGVGSNINDAAKACVFPMAGCRIGVVSLCCPTTNSEYIATHQAGGVAPLSFSTIQKSISAAKQNADLVIVYLHWGCEWVHDPAPDQLRLARHAIDCGAEAVVGCHSHTIQSYEMYKGKWIFYGLGNFCFDAGFAQAQKPDGTSQKLPLSLKPANKESLVVSFVLDDDHLGQPCLALDKVQPFVFDDNFLPRPCREEDLTFSLQEANRRLRAFAKKNQSFLDARGEIEYRSLIRNGIMAYWYMNESIIDFRPPKNRRPLLKIVRTFAGMLKRWVIEPVRSSFLATRLVR